MATSQYTDDELLERIARGDWGADAATPRIDTITRLVSQRQRRRRTTIGAGLAAGLVLLQPPPRSSSAGRIRPPRALRIRQRRLLP